MKLTTPLSPLMLSLTLVLAAGAAEPRPEALAHFTGAEFQGGAKDLFGSNIDGEQVNYVYALPTGAHATSASRQVKLAWVSWRPFVVVQ